MRGNFTVRARRPGNIRTFMRVFLREKFEQKKIRRYWRRSFILKGVKYRADGGIHIKNCILQNFMILWACPSVAVGEFANWGSVRDGLFLFLF